MGTKEEQKQSEGVQRRFAAGDCSDVLAITLFDFLHNKNRVKRELIEELLISPSILLLETRERSANAKTLLYYRR